MKFPLSLIVFVQSMNREIANKSFFFHLLKTCVKNPFLGALNLVNISVASELQIVNISVTFYRHWFDVLQPMLKVVPRCPCRESMKPPGVKFSLPRAQAK